MNAYLLERFPGVIHFRVKNNPTYSEYRIVTNLTLDTLRSAPATLFTVPVGSGFRSRTLRKSGRNWVGGESYKGWTDISYDPADYPAATTPGDDQVAFIAVVPIDRGGAALPAGPSLVIPPPGFFNSGRRVATVRGTAPNVAGLASNLPPQTAMWVDFPKFCNHVTIDNTGSQILAVSFNEGMQEIEIAAGASKTFQETGAQMISLRGSGGTTAFQLSVSLVNGLQS